MVSVRIYINDMQRMQLSIEQTVSHSGSYAPKYACCIFIIKCMCTTILYCLFNSVNI
jgi:hypothetical protein